MLVNIKKSSLLVVDVQEKLIGKIPENKSILQYLEKSIYIFSELNLPIIYSEQYPRGLGSTVNSIKKKLELVDAKKFEKTTFSCFPEDDNKMKSKKILNTNQIIITGIETHICVFQTAIDLKNLGYDIFIIYEAVGSRKKIDKDLAIRRAEREGIKIINFEMLMFELVRDSRHKHFKKFSNLIK